MGVDGGANIPITEMIWFSGCRGFYWIDGMLIGNQIRRKLGWTWIGFYFVDGLFSKSNFTLKFRKCYANQELTFQIYCNKYYINHANKISNIINSCMFKKTSASNIISFTRKAPLPPNNIFCLHKKSSINPPISSTVSDPSSSYHERTFYQKFIYWFP